MKVLGEKSLSSTVKNALEILFYIIALLDFGVLVIGILNFLVDYIRCYLLENYLSEMILTTIIGIIFLLTGIVALFIIYKFIKIFQNLKENKPFERKNIKYLNQISILSLAIGALYLIVLIGVSIILSKYISVNLLSDVLIKILIFTFSIAFFVLGIGMKILNEIYKNAIKYKEENDLTV